MKVVITGGAGFIGQALARALLERGSLAGPGGVATPISELVLFDVEAAALGADGRLRTVVGSVADGDAVRTLIGDDTASLFHLAAVVSAGAEADFDLGYRVNLDGTRHVLEALRTTGKTPRIVFASSIGVYGGDLPDIITDATPARPQLSYGAQKRIGELLIADYTRKGCLDGRGARLPTVLVRPTPPNAAASTWTSSIIRELWRGNDFVCPVGPESRMACVSVRRVVEALIGLHELPSEALGAERTVLLSSIPASARDMADAVARQANGRQIGAITWAPDPALQKLVDGFVKGTQSKRAESLGLMPDPDIDA
ncbi:MAG: NAD-dependent epimerase/dehydratase family protein, partial [Bauldia litoralis]